MTSGGARAPLRLGEMAGPLTLIGVLGAGFGLAGACWVASAAAVLPGAPHPGFGGPVLRALVSATAAGSLDPLIGPAGSRLLFWIVIGCIVGPLLVVAVAGGLWLAVRGGGAGSARRAMAGRGEYRDMRGRGARKRAAQLRPSLGGPRGVSGDDTGLFLGRLGTERIYASEEDVLLEIAGPRSNKTSAVVVPAILSAPGPVIATSNKADYYILTVGPRAAVGQVFVLDPQRIAGVEQTWWINLLADIEGTADATELVQHFMQTVSGERSDPYFTQGAARLLVQLVMAAALTTGRSLRDVRRWLATRSDEPVGLLTAAGAEDLAHGLQGTLEAPGDQQGGLYETALTAISCLDSEPIARYVTPPATWRESPRIGRIKEFDPWQFVVGYSSDEHGPVARDTLFLLTQEGAGSAAPVVAAVVDRVLRVTSAAATARGGRVDPPVRPVLDEAANTCPIKNLPDLYSYYGSKSIQTMAFLQSYHQGTAIWGKAGMDKLWSAATIKLIGAGVQDAEFCEQVSRLIGDHDVPTYSNQRGRGGTSTTVSTRRERILPADQVAALPKTQAVLLSTGRRAGLIGLAPWYSERDADHITSYAAEAADQVRQSAIAALGPRNPLAQVLAAQDEGRGGPRWLSPPR